MDDYISDDNFDIDIFNHITVMKTMTTRMGVTNQMRTIANNNKEGDTLIFDATVAASSGRSPTVVNTIGRDLK